ncbi:MAG: hypothetical protein QOF03_1382 [Alphaproteobacteria bacterium]|nr:hypothetical protein [Alphaproteobacteria bacterium]
MARAVILAQARRMEGKAFHGMTALTRRFQTALCRAALAIGLAVFVSAGAAHADAGNDLTKLLRDYSDAEQKLRPRTAAEHGDSRYLDGYDENATSVYLAARRRINEDMHARLEKIDAPALKAQDKLTFEIFRWDLDDEARELNPVIAENYRLLAFNQFNGTQVTFAREMRWRADYPFAKAQDYDSGIRRMLGFTRWVDDAIGTMRQGMSRGVTQPRVIVERMIAQAENFAAGDPEASLFMAPVKNIPDSITGKDRARVDGAYREAVAGQLIPAYRRLADFLKNEYLPQARESIGLASIPGGKEMYLHLVKSETTSDLSPIQIHGLGLTELKRIEAEMDRVKAETGFSGSLAQFRDFLRSDQRFQFKDSAAMLAEFNRVKNVVDAHLGTMFAATPKSSLTFRFTDSFAAPDRPAAEYAPASGDGRRPGIVYLNASDLSARSSYTSEVLELHEGIPGHHLQLALARENRALPQFRRFGEETAFTEGWGLYAESLGSELGLYTDSYQKFGALSFDAWRASRLVVDTGIHWLGWTHEQAVDYLMTHTALSRVEAVEAVEEVNRYIAIPGQALAYKIGAYEILNLRARAKATLGAKFDLKRFHDVVLKDGPMPLPILDEKVNRWIDQEKGE